MDMNKLSGYINSKQSDVMLLGRLIDQVDRLSKDVTDLKSQMKVRQSRSVAPVQEQGSNEFRAQSNHAMNLVDLMRERPGRYTTSELMDMLGLNKTTVIGVMKRAIEIDPRHVKLTQGKRRKLYLSYIPEEDNQMVDTGKSSGDEDRMRLELMAMT